MGSGDWFKTMICLKPAKGNRRRQLEQAAKKSRGSPASGSSMNSARIRQQITQDAAALRIQTAFRAYMARKAVRRIKGVARFRGVIEERHGVKNQASSALNHIHFWSRIQEEIKARRLGMVIQGQTRQRKLENQLKLDAKLQEVEVEWCGGPETMEEILSRILQREEAAARRERAMAYAFSHQWRANSNQYFGQAYYDLGKESWGWSWKERWIAVRPWENRVQAKPISLAKKVETKQKTSEITSTSPTKAAVSVGKLVSSNGKVSDTCKKSPKNLP